MREREAGFTLVEFVIAVAIATMLLAAGGAWMLSMRPGALRNAVNDFDSALAAARQLAATSGNGATLAFVPRTDNARGYELRVYSGRPTTSTAVIATSIRASVSEATISEATLGAPPFAIFLSSAGNPTGKASYPAIDGAGNASFPRVARQPPCPANGLTLTFTSPQGVTATRMLPCNTVAVGTAAPDPSPTPNAPHIAPAAMVAHWTNDRGGALKFKVAEFGYAGAFAKADFACDSIATFVANPVTAIANPNPDEPAANFELYPIPGSPGTCTVSVEDSYGQQVHASVQIMGDLTWLNRQRTPLVMNVGDSQALDFGKTYDSEALQLQAGGNCGGVITARIGSASITIKAVAANACTLVVGDQYGEPPISIPIDVKNPIPMATWPMGVKYAVSGEALAGADAAGTCTAIAYSDAAMTVVDANDSTFSSLGVTTDGSGCFNGSLIAYEPGGGASTYYVSNKTCLGGELQQNTWSSMPAVSAALSMTAGTTPVPSCTITLQDSGNTGQGTGGHGLVMAAVIGQCSTSGQVLAVGGECIAKPSGLLFAKMDCNWPASWNDGWVNTNWYVTISGPATLSGNVITRTGVGPISVATHELNEHITTPKTCKWVNQYVVVGTYAIH